MCSAYYIIQKLWEQLHLTAIIPTCLIWAKFLQAQLNYPFCSYRSICARNLWEHFIVCSASGSSSELCNNLHCGHLKWCLCIFMNSGFWGQSVIHRTQHRTVECVFYIEHRKYGILVIMLSISLVLTLFSFLLNINLYIFFIYHIIIILSHCVMLFWRENKIGNRPCLGETGWGRYTFCRIFLFLLPAISSCRNWHSWVISMFIIYTIRKMNSFFWKLCHLLCISHDWSQVTTNSILLSLLWEVVIACETCRIFTWRTFK